MRVKEQGRCVKGDGMAWDGRNKCVETKLWITMQLNFSCLLQRVLLKKIENDHVMPLARI